MVDDFDKEFSKGYVPFERFMEKKKMAKEFPLVKSLGLRSTTITINGSMYEYVKADDLEAVLQKGLIVRSWGAQGAWSTIGNVTNNLWETPHQYTKPVEGIVIGIKDIPKPEPKKVTITAEDLEKAFFEAYKESDIYDITKSEIRKAVKKKLGFD